MTVDMNDIDNTLPVLYSFRRCPYAMRARMAIRYSQTTVELREIKLSSKPAHMLAVSPKGTVPVLILPDGGILEESLDIIDWALSRYDPQDWSLRENYRLRAVAGELIQANDLVFKQQLDRYKYANRHPEHPATYYRDQALAYLYRLDRHLQQNRYLLSDHISIADIAIVPFIRQFAYVDITWFQQSDFKQLQSWLQGLIESPLFMDIMEKYPLWDGENALFF